MFKALGVDRAKEVKVNFLTFMRMIKMLNESEARRQHGSMVGFGRDRTDKIFGLFQKLERSRDFSDPGLPKARIEHMLANLSARWISKMQQAELIRVLNQEPSQVDFGGFLRLMKALETMVSDSYEECVDDLLRLVMDAA